MAEFILNIKCSNDDDFCHDRLVDYSCNSYFNVKEDDIFSVVSFNYFDESMREYYVICPKCGRINKINNESLTDDIKREVDDLCESEAFLYKKNDLKSYLIYLNLISPPKTRIRRR